MTFAVDCRATDALRKYGHAIHVYMYTEFYEAVKFNLKNRLKNFDVLFFFLCSKYWLWVLVRTASAPSINILSKNIKKSTEMFQFLLFQKKNVTAWASLRNVMEVRQEMNVTCCLVLVSHDFGHICLLKRR